MKGSARNIWSDSWSRQKGHNIPALLLLLYTVFVTGILWLYSGWFWAVLRMLYRWLPTTAICVETCRSLLIVNVDIWWSGEEASAFYQQKPVRMVSNHKYKWAFGFCGLHTYGSEALAVKIDLVMKTNRFFTLHLKGSELSFIGPQIIANDHEPAGGRLFTLGRG